MTTKVFEQIYDETHLKLYAFLYAKCPTGEDAADLLQETYLEYIKADRRHGAEYIKEPIAFLTQIAKKKLAKVYGNRRIVPLSLEEEYDDGVPLADTLFDKNETEWTTLTKAQAEQIWRFLEKKGPVTLKIFTLFYRGGYKIKEIAEIMELSESQVKNKLYRTLRELRETYAKEESI